MNSKIITIDIKDNYRIVAISDVHAHLELLKSLLDTVRLQDDDWLVLIGDFINKGPDSLATLRYMMELVKRPKTVILKGNHEFFICHYIYMEGGSDKFNDYLKKKHFINIVHDMVGELGMTLEDITSGAQLSQLMLEHYREEFDFINTLPVIAFIDDCIFVHGGYDDEIDIEEDENSLLKFDNFNELSKVHDSKVIVGHWPTANLRRNRNSNAPYFNDAKNIISIDGGIGVKSSGELNALTITKTEGQCHIDYIQENHFEKAVIKAHHTFKTEDKYFINFPHFDIEVVEEGDRMTLCRHVQSGKHLSIFNSLLETVDDKPQVITTYINHFLNLKVGEEVEICMTYEDCVLVKHDGEFGWILREQL